MSHRVGARAYRALYIAWNNCLQGMSMFEELRVRARDARVR